MSALTTQMSVKEANIILIKTTLSKAYPNWSLNTELVEFVRLLETGDYVCAARILNDVHLTTTIRNTDHNNMFVAISTILESMS